MRFRLSLLSVRFLLSLLLHSSGWNITSPKPSPCVRTMDSSYPAPERFLPLEMILIDSQFCDLIGPVSGRWSSKVVEVDVSHNKLKDVSSCANFYHLERLDLECNRIGSVLNEALASSKYLEELNSLRSRIPQISEVAFKNFRSLHRIILSGNILKSFSLSLNISDLRELYLNGDLIESNFPELLNFSSFNKNSGIRPRLLTKCCRPKDLNSTQDSFVEAPRQALLKITSTIVKLNLSSMLVAIIRSDAFTNLFTIQEIDLPGKFALNY